jgi:hypothetical protein
MGTGVKLENLELPGRSCVAPSTNQNGTWYFGKTPRYLLGHRVGASQLRGRIDGTRARSHKCAPHGGVAGVQRARFGARND